jgi:peptidoglycan hydrolase-like protein with peptidoglycan-binding domain
MAQPITKTLSLGMVDPQVTALQQFLNANGFPVAPAGQPGSAGNETDHFGAATLAAVRAFQASKGIVSSGTAQTTGFGVVGPQTLEAIGKITPSVAPTTQSSTVSSSTGTSGQTGTSNIPGQTHISGTVASGDNSSLQSDRDKIRAIMQKQYPDRTPDQIDQMVSAYDKYIPGGAGSAVTEVIPEKGTPEWNAAVESVKSGIYDIANLVSNADTEEQHAVAMNNLQMIIDNANRTLGTNLSNDAMTAWSQIQKMGTDMYGNSRGLAGSGMEAEQMDDYLRNVRANDEKQREQTASDIDQKEASYYQTSASPDEVKQLVNTDPKKAQAYGLVPSDTVRKSLDPQALHEKYPTMAMDDINNMVSQHLDANGNYMSSSAAKLASTVGQNLSTQKGEAELGLQDIIGYKTEQQQIPYQADQKDPNVAFGKNTASPAFSTSSTSNPNPM